MIHTVRYTKKNSFMKAHGDPTIYKNGEDGLPIAAGKYKSNTIPKTFQIKRIKWDGNRRSYDIKISQDDLDSLVKEIGLYTSDGRMIETANLRNELDPFFSHPELSFRIENGSNQLDDSNPLHKLQLIWMRTSSDRQFHVQGGEDNPALRGMAFYTVTTPAQDADAVTADNDKMVRAIRILDTMTYDTQCKVLQAMNVSVAASAEPKVVRDALIRKVTEEKNSITYGTRERNIDVFLRLAEEPSEELNLKSIITSARDFGLIKKAKDGIYKFGEIQLGRTIEAVHQFLGDDGNHDVVTLLTDQLRTKGVPV